MRLKDYLFKLDMPTSVLARQLEVHPQYLRRIRKGDIKPSYKLALKIEVVTGGNVTVQDLLGEKIDEHAIDS